MKSVTAEQKRRAQTVATLLDEIIPNPNAALDYRSPFALLIATLLSAQCHDEQVNRVMPTFLKRAPSPEAACALSEAEIGAIIHSCGFFRVKARYIATLSRKRPRRFFIIGKFGRHRSQNRLRRDGLRLRPSDVPRGYPRASFGA